MPTDTGEIFMTEEKKHSWLLRWVIFVLRSPIISLLTAAVVYYAVQAFVVNDSSFLYKLKLFAALFLWMLWLISKYLLKIFVFLVLIGTALYGYYHFSNREAAACEESGRVWNREKKICEEKNNWWRKILYFIEDSSEQTPNTDAAKARD